MRKTLTALSLAAILAVGVAFGQGIPNGYSDVSGIITVLNSILSAIQSPLAGVLQAQTSSAASSLVAKNAAGSLISVSGSAVAGSYIMVFNATSAPGDGAVTPTKCWGPMASSGPFSFSWGVGPILMMSTGITIVSSSTGCFTKTATNANFISAEYQ